MTLIATRPSDRLFAIVRYGLTLLIPLAFFLYTMGFTRGPSFASSDEGGYLSWAKIVAGKSSPIGSPVYPGYGILLAPLYSLFQSPEQIWLGVVFLNFLLCIGALILGDRLLLILRPEVDNQTRLIALVVAGSYPMFGTMMGYAFTSIASTFFLLLAIVQIKSVVNDDRIGTVIFVITTGFLSILHPTHLVFCIFALGLISTRAFPIQKRVLWAGALLAIVAAGQRILKPYLFGQVIGNSTKTTLGYSATERFFSGLSDFSRYGFFLRELVTLLYSLTISSFGTIGILFFAIGREFQIMKSEGKKNLNFHILLGICTCLIGYTLLTAQGFGFVPESTYIGKRIEEHVFLRYVEPALVPTLLISVLYFPLLRIRRVWIALQSWNVVVILLGGIALTVAITTKLRLEGELGRIDYLTFMANGFWPAALVRVPNGQAWTIIAICTLLVLATKNRVVFAGSLVLVCAVTLPVQRDHYLWFYSNYAETSSLTTIMREIYPAGTCIAFDETQAPPSLNRSDLYQWVEFGNFAFQFPQHNFQKLNPKDWGSSCDGPLLSLSAAIENLSPIAHDSSTGFYMYVKDRVDLARFRQKYPEIIVQNDASDSCIRDGCFGLNAHDLRLWSDKESSSSDGVITTNTQKILVDIRGGTLNQGQFTIHLYGEFLQTDGVSFRLFANDDKTVIKSGNVSQSGAIVQSHEIQIPFRLLTWVSDLRIQLLVREESQIAISGLRIGPTLGT